MTSPHTPPPAIKACLFDMDGLLIDSEDKYTIVTNEVLTHYGRPELPWSIKAQMQGRPGPSAGKIFHDWAQLPITHTEFLEFQKPLQAKHFPSCKPLPGALELLEALQAARSAGGAKVQIALATSSHKRNYELKTDHLPQLVRMFQPENVVLGDDERIPPGRGKPAPDIYLLALKTINDRLKKEGQAEILPEECLVFEDSVPGVEAGRRAGMQAVWCPHTGLLNEYKGREKEVLAGLTGEHKEEEQAGEEVKEETRQGQTVRTKGAPGEIDDGWGRFFKSLEAFPLEDYGIKVQPNL